GAVVYERESPDKYARYRGTLLFTPDGKHLLARLRWIDGSRSPRIEILDATNGGSARFVELPRLGSLAVSPDSRNLAAAAGAGLRVWDLATLKEFAANAEAHYGPVWLTRVSRHGILATGADDETIRLWDATTAKQRRVHDLGLARDIALSPDGN